MEMIGSRTIEEIDMEIVNCVFEINYLRYQQSKVKNTFDYLRIENECIYYINQINDLCKRKRLVEKVGDLR